MRAIKPKGQIWRWAAVAVATSLALTACGNKVKEMEQQQKAKMKDMQPTIHVVTVQPENVLLENNLPGRLQAIRSATIVPQVNGIVKRRLFQEGAMVSAGQPLYEIDGTTYQAGLQTARAGLLSAQAALAKANTDVERYRPLVAADAISKQEWDAALAAKRSAEAQIAAAQASINAAQVNLNYTTITAPISGYIGQSLVTEGALVNAHATQMAVINQNDPMYVNITQSSADMLKLRQQLASGQKVMNSSIEVGIKLEDGSDYPYKGRLLFSDTMVDKNTGQVTLRAAIPNPQQLLMSGMYVRVILPLAGILDAYVVPQQAVNRGQTDTLMIANQNGELEPRTVKIGGQKGNAWVITEGLKAGDRVVMDGVMSAGMLGVKKFKLQEWQPENTAQHLISGSPSVSASSKQADSEPTDAPTLDKQAVSAASATN